MKRRRGTKNPFEILTRLKIAFLFGLCHSSGVKIADIHYLREDFIEAQHAYEIFKELHPKHTKSDYVTYRLAMSYYNQVPDIISRDLTAAESAILYFDEVIQTYPQSEFVKQSGENKLKALKRLAEKFCILPILL